MSDRARKVFAVFRSFETRDLFAALFVILFTSGLANAAINQKFSETVSGNMHVSKGINFTVDNVSGKTSPTSFESDMGSGGGVSMVLKKVNKVDDVSDPSVETLVIDSEGNDLSWKYLESVGSFRNSSVSEARMYDFDVGVRGEPSIMEKHFTGYGTDNRSLTYNETVSSNTNNYFGVANADVDSDSLDEVIVCIAEGEGTRYGSKEEWSGNMSIDTKSSFPTGTVSMEMDIMALYNPETGAHPEKVRKCPQYN